MDQAGHGQDWEQFLVAPNNNPGVPLNAGEWQPEVPGEAPRVGDDGSRRLVFRRRSPAPLSLLCQIQVLKPLLNKASSMERDYMDVWCNQLSLVHRTVEEETNIRGPDFNTEEVVQKYRAHEELVIQRKKAKAWDTMRKQLEQRTKKKKGKAGKEEKSKTVTSVVKRPGVATRASKRREAAEAVAPYRKTRKPSMWHPDEDEEVPGDPRSSDFTVDKWGQPANWPRYWRPKVVRGIPEWALAKNYIQYRKCKYIEDIRTIRTYLTSHLSAPVLRDLMATMCNLAKYNDKSEYGLLTLQAMLMNKHIADFRIAPPMLHNNFAAVGKGIGVSGAHGSHAPTLSEKVESRIPTTILHYTLVEGTSLVNIDLEKCACDSLLKILAQVAPNVKYLNISHSMVSDKGLMYLCGVEKSRGSRKRLTRKCKEQKDEEKKLVTNETPKWEKKWNACDKITHLLAEELRQIDWSGVGAYKDHGHMHAYQRKYYNHPAVPIDSGFVAVLAYLRDLRVLVSEVGARAVHALTRLQSKRKVTKFSLKLETITEKKLMPNVFHAVIEACPRLSSLNVERGGISVGGHVVEEDMWVEELSKCGGLKELVISEVSFSNNRLCPALTSIGHMLTRLEVLDLYKVKYSQLRLLKMHCKNLEVLAISMVMGLKRVMMSATQIQVDKDHNLMLHSNEREELSRLRELHLNGPFGFEVVRYLLTGALDLRVLTLSIEWLDPTFCDSQPSGRKDLVGREYLEEVLSVNPLPRLEELHMLAQYRQGSSQLTKDCAEFVLSRFPALRHLGYFDCWNMRRGDIRELIKKRNSSNRDIIFDEDLYSRSVDVAGDHFEFKYIPDRHRFSCTGRRLMCKDDRITNSLFTDLFALAGGPMLLDAIDEDDDDESLSSEEDDLGAFNDINDFAEMDEDEDDLLLGPPGGGEGNGEPNPCAIM